MYAIWDHHRKGFLIETHSYTKMVRTKDRTTLEGLENVALFTKGEAEANKDKLPSYQEFRRVPPRLNWRMFK